jgi:hypothetical protein
MSILHALMISAQMAGVAVDQSALRPVGGAAAEGPQIVGQAPLKGISAGQNRAEMFRVLDKERLGFSLALGPDGYLWLRVRRGEAIKNFSLPSLEGGVEADLGGVWYRFRLEGDRILARDRSQQAQAELSLSALVGALYDLGLHAAFGPVVYSMMYEDGAFFPEASGLLRKDSEGRYWVTYHRRDGAKLHWFVAINGRMFGFRIEGTNLVFYAQSTDASALSESEIPAFLNTRIQR